MFNKIKKQVGNNRGLSLVELLAVVVIIGIIAAIAVPSIGGIVENTRAKALLTDVVTAADAAELYFIENGDRSTVALNELSGKYLSNAGSITAISITKDGKIASVTAKAGTITHTVSSAGTKTKADYVKALNDKTLYTVTNDVLALK